MKKFLSLLLTLLLLSSHVVYANDSDIVDNGECGDEATWTLFEDGELVVSGSGDAKFLDDNIEEYLDEIKIVTIEEGIIGIGYVDDCINLTEINFPNTLTTVNGFNNCGIKEIKFPITVKTIDRAFNDCENLKRVYLPKNMEYFDNAFIECTNLEYVEWNSSNSFKCKNSYEGSFERSGTAENGLKLVFGDNCEAVPDYLCIGSDITQVVLGKNIKRIGAEAFRNCYNLKSVTFSEGLLEIGEYAFYRCESLTSVLIPNSVETIEDGVFEGCTNLEKVVSPMFINLEDCEKIEELKITNETLERLESTKSSWYLPGSIERLSVNLDVIEGLYSSETLKYLEIGKKAEMIKESCFCGNVNIEELSIPFVGRTRTSNGTPDAVLGYMFANPYNSSSKGVIQAEQHYSSSNSEIYFIYPSLKKVYVTDATQIPYGAFSGCSGLEYIELNEGITQIGQKAFADCGFLSVKIPKSVTQIGTDAFSGTDVEKLYVYENSYAHNYAKENNFKYELVGSSKTNTNETENDNIIDKDSREEVSKEINVKSITLNYDDVELAKGETITLQQTISPSNATNKKVIWNSSKSSVATVKNGKVTAVGTGTAIITATTEEGNKTASCAVIVSDNTNENDENKQIILKIGSKSARVFGKVKTNDVAPKIVNSRTMLPARFVTENLGATVTWTESAPDMVLITKDNVTIIIYIGSDIAYVNGEKLVLDSPAFIENNRTYTPIRFISEALGANVEWNGNTQEVIITK